MNDKKLGRGLDYLLNLSKNEKTPDYEGEIGTKKNIENIDLKYIRKNRFQPRKDINEDTLKDLSNSIKENGVLQPILVKKDGNNYELIAGERRYLACTLLEKETIPAIVLDVPENKMLQFALIENIQRENLNPIDEAQAYQTMLRLEQISHEDLSIKVGKKRSTISNSLRLLDLPLEIQEHVSRGTISQGHARALLGLQNSDDQFEVFKRILTEGLSVRDVERIQQNKKTLKERKILTKENKISDKQILQLENKLKDSLGTKIKIKSKKDKGYIEIYFYSKDDFSRLYNFLIFNKT